MKNNILNFVLLLGILMMGCKKDENITTPTSTQGEWKIVRNADSTNRFWGLCFADQMNGWAVGDSGKILHTNDGGNSWNVQESGTKISLRCVYFANSQKGWVGGANDSIGITTNGGITWSWQHPAGESRRTFMSMSFVDEHTGWIVDNYAGILQTEDGGMTWTPQMSGTTWAITSVQFLDVKEGWAVATNRVVLHTTDGGNNWITKILDTLNYGSGITVIYNNIFFCNRSRGWIATTALASNIANQMASVVCTSDTGRTWIVQPSPEIYMINSLKFVNENMGWAAGDGGILQTTNGGEKWTYVPEVTDNIFVDIWFIDFSHGWAITFTGNIYRYQAS